MNHVHCTARPPAVLLAVLAAGLGFAAGPSAAKVISLNFGAEKCAVPSGKDPIGLTAVPGEVWVNASGKAGTLAGNQLKQWNGTAAEIFTVENKLKVTWDSSNTWQFAVPDPILCGYLDDDQGSRKKPVSVTVSDIPYETYSVILYAATGEKHQVGLRPFGINGTYYAGTAEGTSLFEAGDGSPTENKKISWGERQAPKAAYGITSLRIKGLTDPTMKLTGITGDQYVARGSLAAIQIVEESPVTYKAAVTGNTAWESLVWTASDGSALPEDGQPPADAFRELEVNAAEAPVISVTADMPAFAGLSATAPVVLERLLTEDDQQAVLPGIRPEVTFSVLPDALPVGRNITQRIIAEPAAGVKTTPLRGGRSLSVTVDPAQPLNAASININFFRQQGNETIGGVEALPDLLGLWKVAGTDWNDVNAANGTGSGLKVLGADGSITVGTSTVSVKVTGSVSWSAAEAVDPLQLGFVDEKNGYLKPKTTVSGIPFSRYRALIYFSTGEGSVPFAPIEINGTWYCGTPSKNGTMIGEKNWGDTGPKNSSLPIAEGQNVLVSEVLSGNLNLCQLRRAPARCCVSAIQIVACDTVNRSVGGNYTVRVGSGGMWDQLEWTPAPGDADLSKSTVCLETGDIPATVQITRPLKIGRLRVTGASALTLEQAAPEHVLTAEASVFEADTEIIAGTAILGGYTIADGKKLTVHASPDAVGTRLNTAGTLRVAGTSSETPLKLTWTGKKDSSFGAVEIAENTRLAVAVPGNVRYDIVGSDPLTSVLELTCGDGFGMTDGSRIENLTLRSVTPDLFWIQNTLNKPSVVLDIGQGGVKIFGFEPVFGGLKGSGKIEGYQGMTLKTSSGNGQLSFTGTYASAGPLTVLGDGRQLLSGTHTSAAALALGDGTDKPMLLADTLLTWAGDVTVSGGARLLTSEGMTVGGNLTFAAGAELSGVPITVTGNVTLPDGDGETVRFAVRGKAGTEVFSCANAAALDLTRLSGAPAGLVFALNADRTSVILADPNAPQPTVPDFVVPGAEDAAPTPEQADVLMKTLEALNANPAGRPVTVAVNANGSDIVAADTFAAAADALTLFTNIAAVTETEAGLTLQVAYTFSAGSIAVTPDGITVTAVVARPATSAAALADLPGPAYADGVRIKALGTDGTVLGTEISADAGTASASLTLPPAAQGTVLFRIRAEK